MTQSLRPYVIKQGDYLAKLAYVHGFDPSEVWNHEKNKAIKALREPDILYPGDIVYIPVGRTGGLAIRAGAGNRYKAQVPTVEVTLVFDDWGNPLSDEPCELYGLPGHVDEPKITTTDGSGKLAVSLPVTVTELEVFMPEQNTAYQVHVGALDPKEEVNGLRGRLSNLGYLDESVAGSTTESAQQLYLERTRSNGSGSAINDSLDREFRNE